MQNRDEDRHDIGRFPSFTGGLNVLPTMSTQTPTAVSKVPTRNYILANWIAGIVTPLRAPRGRAHQLIPAWRRYALWSLLIAAIIAALMIWVDAAAMRAVAMLPARVNTVFNEITDFGRGAWPLVPLGTLLVVTSVLSSPRLGHLSRGVLAAVAVRLGYMFAAIALTGLADSVLKRLIGRIRPSEFGPFAFDPISWRSDYASFPSGHTTNVFATLVAVGLIFPRARPLLWIYALLIAASRVIVSAHYPSDVLAGAAFGAFGAILVRDWFAARRVGFFVGSDGGVRPMPAPSFRRIKRVARAVFGQ
jgi:membrane-associated phospholipid phosphatase